jgi:redox-sensitive bicupin YhaK (pirin superfamily)
MIKPAATMTKSVQTVLRPHGAHWVGDGFPVRTIFAAHAQDSALISPFLLFDYAGPKSFPPSDSDEPRGVDEHPHRGFETVTIVYEGSLEHRDSAGNSGTIGPGDVQWMTAASGVVHEEKHERAFTRRGGVFEVVQLWVNLPAREKMSAPRYQELKRANIPVVELENGAGTARIIAGDLRGTRGPARTVTPLNVWDIRLRRGGEARFSLPDGTTTLVAALRGAITIDDHAVQPAEAALLTRDGAFFTIHADDDAAVLLLNGEPIDEPVAAHGPFVMNTRDEIKQAMIDYQSGRMGSLSQAAP